MTQLLTREMLPPELKTAVAAFSLAIPFLVIFAVVQVPGEPVRELRGSDSVTWLLFTASCLLGLCGILLLFWFVRPVFGVSFLISGIAAYGWLLYRVRMPP